MALANRGLARRAGRSKTGCGATIVEGSSHSNHDGRPTTYLGCKADHCGEIITASSNAKVEP
ncbi:hypothetical protein [Vreelandella sp. GE22]